jgi:phosphate acetyltransferase
MRCPAQLQSILDRARKARRSIVFPESEDARVLRAAARLAREGIVEPVLLGEPAAVAARAATAGAALAGVSVVHPEGHAERERCLAAATTALARRGLERPAIEELLRDPLYYGAAMVRAGIVAGSVAGATHATADTLRAALRLLGPAHGVRVVSSFFLMALREPTAAGDEVLAFADCGLVPEPDAEQLAEIAQGTADEFLRLVGREPHVAFLSYSTKGSADGPAVERVRQATARLLELRPAYPVDGELQADAALVPEVGRSKAPGSAVAGRANVLIFPDLDAGNIAYKLVERLAGAQAVGPLLRGLAWPANDLSRGCGEDDVVLAAAVTAVQAGEDRRPV